MKKGAIIKGVFITFISLTSLILFFLIYLSVVSFHGRVYNTENNFCTNESRNAQACYEIYNPVCGYFSQDIKCIKAPCAQTYSNECFACMDPKVSYWEAGECPV